MDRVRESRIKLLPIQYARMTYVIDPNISIGGDPSRQVSSLCVIMSFETVVFFSQPHIYIFFIIWIFLKIAYVAYNVIVTILFQYSSYIIPADSKINSKNLFYPKSYFNSYR